MSVPKPCRYFKPLVLITMALSRSISPSDCTFMRIYSTFRWLTIIRSDTTTRHRCRCRDDNSQSQIPTFKKVTNDPKVVLLFSIFLLFTSQRLSKPHTCQSVIEIENVSFEPNNICTDFYSFYLRMSFCLHLNLLPMKNVCGSLWMLPFALHECFRLVAAAFYYFILSCIWTIHLVWSGFTNSIDQINSLVSLRTQDIVSFSNGWFWLEFIL